MAYVSPKRLYRTLDGSVVEEGDPAAASLLIAANIPISEQEVKRYGIEDKVQKIGDRPEPQPVGDMTSRIASIEARLAALEGDSGADSGAISTAKAVAGPPEDKAASAKA